MAVVEALVGPFLLVLAVEVVAVVLVASVQAERPVSALAVSLVRQRPRVQQVLGAGLAQTVRSRSSRRTVLNGVAVVEAVQRPLQPHALVVRLCTVEEGEAAAVTTLTYQAL